MIIKNIVKYVNRNFLAEGNVQLQIPGRIPPGNIIFSNNRMSAPITTATAISSSTNQGFLSSTSRRRSFASERRKLVGDYPFKLTMVLIKLLNALRASIYQPFSKSCGFFKSEFIICNVSLSNVCFIDLLKVGQFRCIWCLV
jgi:hypothetical protein